MFVCEIGCLINENNFTAVPASTRPNIPNKFSSSNEGKEYVNTHVVNIPQFPGIEYLARSHFQRKGSVRSRKTKTRIEDAILHFSHNQNLLFDGHSFSRFKTCLGKLPLDFLGHIIHRALRVIQCLWASTVRIAGAKCSWKTMAGVAILTVFSKIEGEGQYLYHNWIKLRQNQTRNNRKRDRRMIINNIKGPMIVKTAPGHFQRWAKLFKLGNYTKGNWRHKSNHWTSASWSTPEWYNWSEENDFVFYS